MTSARADRRTLDRYRLLAPAYDRLSFEHVLYRSGRRAAVEALNLTPGQRVLDIGCGTGLTMPAPVTAVPP